MGSKVKHSRPGTLKSGELPKVQQEILFMLTTEFLTINQIAIRRKCSKQAVYEVISKLKNKGFLKEGFTVLEKNQSTLTLSSKLRLHGQEFHINILNKDERYKQLKSKSNLINIDGNTIRLFDNSMEVYIGQSFFGEDVNQITKDSIDYFNKLLPRLENDFKVILIRSRYQNISIVNSHYAEINNELSRECIDRGEKIRVYTNEDGKLWFLIDKSFNIYEAETLHPNTSKQDMGKVRDFFNDIRDKETLQLSELSRYMADTTKQINEISHGLKIIIDLHKPIELEESKLERPNYIQ
jgi:hypothetical protein